MESGEGRARGLRRYAPLLLFLFLYAVLVFLFRGFVIDDSYITFRDADNIARGGAPSFNADDAVPVEGYTSFLWVALSAAAIRCGIDPLAAARAIAVAACAKGRAARSVNARRPFFPFSPSTSRISFGAFRPTIFPFRTVTMQRESLTPAFPI
ncbi:MAG: hypothetical protein JW958_02605 [Candidatus Eisenbacteria bacterium]|nr:hypothetical protein [Candidatus Eisenbacteria bacterium]